MMEGKNLLVTLTLTSLPCSRSLVWPGVHAVSDFLSLWMVELSFLRLVLYLHTLAAQDCGRVSCKSSMVIGALELKVLSCDPIVIELYSMSSCLSCSSYIILYYIMLY